MKRRCHPILQNLVQLAEAMPFDSIFLANQLAGNKRATLAYVPDVDLLHYGVPPCPSHVAAALFRSSKASTVAAAIRAISGISSSGRWPARSRATQSKIAPAVISLGGALF